MSAMTPGSYYGRPIRAILTKIGANNKPAFAITFDVHSVAHNGEWVRIPNPEQRTVKMFLTEAAYPFTEAKLKAFGFNGDFANPLFNEDFNAGTELVCTNRQDPANGRTYDDFDFPRTGGQELEAADIDTVRLFNAKWKTAHAAAAKPMGRPMTPPPRPAPAAPPATSHATVPPGDNEPPF